MTKTALITGATSGIGRATALRFAALGYRLILTGRRAERLASLREDILLASPASHILTLSFDIRCRETVKETIDSLPETWKAIDILVNNAGLAAGLDDIDQGDTDDWDRMVDTNVKGLLYITRAVAPLMVARSAGHIVNIGSIAGRETYEKGNVYCATKHAVAALSQGMRIDLLKHGIKVSQVRPGMVYTEFSEVRFHGDILRADTVYQGVTPLTADDIARTIEWIITQPPHVNINDVEVMPLQQADAFYTCREQ